MFPIIEPSSGRLLKTVDAHGPDERKARLELASVAFRDWRTSPMQDRVELLRALAGVLRERADGLAHLMATEMGKPVRDGRSEVAKCAWWCEWLATEGPGLLGDRLADVGREEAYVTYQPLGIVLGVMPWNYPLWQVFRYAAPAILAGNSVLLKHAPNVPGTTLVLEDLFREVLAPAGLFQALLIPVEQLEDVVAHPLVRAATLTGSTRAGRAFARLAAGHLVPTVLELGGSDAAVVLEDADIEAAARLCVTSRLLNGGQSCISAKRFIVVEAVADAFIDAVHAEMASAVVGDPYDEETAIGPLAREDLRDTLRRQVDDSIAGGARCLLGGVPDERAGWFYPPTLLVDVPLDVPVATEEVFGPVASVFRVPDEAAAISLANATSFGLGAAVFTADVRRGERIAREELEAGCCFVNGFVKSDPRVPFGGIGDSGYGRELGPEGVRQFTNTKTVWLTS